MLLRIGPHTSAQLRTPVVWTGDLTGRARPGCAGLLPIIWFRRAGFAAKLRRLRPGTGGGCRGARTHSAASWGLDRFPSTRKLLKEHFGTLEVTIGDFTNGPGSHVKLINLEELRPDLFPPMPSLW